MTVIDDSSFSVSRTPPTAGQLEFSKYTSFGNTFIIVDETEHPLTGDLDRACFARWALNRDFGIGGADNVLYLHRAGSQPGDGDLPAADYVFRIFEHDGSETLSCGNGLLSTAAFLRQSTGGSSWRVLTELPSARPATVVLGAGPAPDGTNLRVGRPRPAADDLYRRTGPEPQSSIDEVLPLVVPLDIDQPWAAGLPQTITLNGLLTFTGEPHLALFEGSGFPAVLADRIWLRPDETSGSGIGLPPTPAMRASTSLVRHIGAYVNATYQDLFPQGVHLNFARVDRDRGVIESRTYERAIDCETLACGSGSVALAHVALNRGLLNVSEITVWPHRCRWYEPGARLLVTSGPTGYVLAGRPRLVVQGMVTR
jgi:diaminopimelate epimerase